MVLSKKIIIKSYFKLVLLSIFPLVIFACCVLSDIYLTYAHLASSVHLQLYVLFILEEFPILAKMDIDAEQIGQTNNTIPVNHVP